MSVFQWVLWFFDVFSNPAEKQRTKPIDSNSMKVFASFDTNDTPGSAKIKPERKFDQMSLCANGMVTRVSRFSAAAPMVS